jgi:lysozyme
MKLQGIDLSKWNTVPDYDNLSGSGLAFVYIKASEAGYSDATYIARHRAIGETGLLRGSYHFFKAAVDPIVQAEAFLNSIGHTIVPGEMPPVLDIEDPKEKLTVTQYEEAVAKWLGYVETHTGIKPMIYTGGWYWKQLKTLNNNSQFKDFSLWLSSYTRTYGKMFGGWTAPKIWQYSETGNIAGIKPVDMNYFYGSPEDLWTFARMKSIGNSDSFLPKAKAVQKRLSSLGFYKHAIDGMFGPNTENAVKEFQKSKGLTEDGIMGVKSWMELFGIKTF